MIALAAPLPVRSRGTEWLVAELSRPAAYPRAVKEVSVRRTLVSVLFFAGDRVYKVKQALDLGFIDASTLDRRRFLCAEEVRLNAALAPGVHLGVVPITLGLDGHLAVGGRGELVEWAVEMVRLPEELMLARLIERGGCDNAQMNALAERLAAFHRTAPSDAEIATMGTPAALGIRIEENFWQLHDFVGRAAQPSRTGIDVLSPTQHAFLRVKTRGFLVKERPLLLQRVASGRVREGHGDLHAENICQLPQGFLIYDRIEFNRNLRCLDVANDVAFLAMDLDYRGFPGFGAYLARRYAELARDEELPRLLGFYKGYRALVRAKVAALTARQAGAASERREELRREAMRYVQLALGYELPPALVLMVGLPGTGKSHLAGTLARPLRAALFHSDERRKRLAGLAAETRAASPWGEGLYTPDARERVYRSLLEDTATALRAGRSVVVDASFARRAFRRPFVDAATRLGVPYCLMHVSAPEELVRARMAARDGGPSDADFEVYRRECAAFEPPDEVPGGHVVHAPAGRAPEEHAAALFDRLIALEAPQD